MFIDNLSVKFKALAPLVLMVALFFGVLTMSLTTTTRLESRYQDLTTRSAPAVRALMSVTRTATLLAVNAMLIQDYKCTGRDAAKCSALLTTTREAELSGRQDLDEAARLDPSRAPDIERYKESFGQIAAGIEPLLAKGMADDDSAVQDMDALALKLTLFSQQLNAANRQVEEANDRIVAALSSDGHDNLVWMIGLAIAVTLIGLSAAYWMAVSKLSRPLVNLSEVMRKLAGGDLTVTVDGQGRRDEIGAMVAAVQILRANGLQAVATASEAAAGRANTEVERARNEAERAREAAEDQAAMDALARGLDALANGNLTHQIAENFAPKTQQLKTDFNQTATRLRETIATIAGAIQGMSSGTGEISQAADDLSRRTEQQAASLEQTAAALDEITATVRKTAEGASHVQSVVANAKNDTEHSSQVVRDAVQAMGEIETSAQQVGQIIGVIDEIAFQTNLLALNAGVEAARAGDAGRGFAVVASEVRALAQRSAEAAKEIKLLISASSKQVGRGVKLVDETGASLQRIAGHVAEVYSAITEIASSAKEQSTGLQEVNTAINQMDQVTQQNAAMVEQSTAASHGLAQETAELGRLTSHFQTGEHHAASTSRPAPRGARTKSAPLRVVARTGGSATPSSAAAAGDANSWQEF